MYYSDVLYQYFSTINAVKCSFYRLRRVDLYEKKQRMRAPRKSLTFTSAGVLLKSDHSLLFTCTKKCRRLKQSKFSKEISTKKCALGKSNL